MHKHSSNNMGGNLIHNDTFWVELVFSRTLLTTVLKTKKAAGFEVSCLRNPPVSSAWWSFGNIFIALPCIYEVGRKTWLPYNPICEYSHLASYGYLKRCGTNSRNVLSETVTEPNEQISWTMESSSCRLNAVYIRLWLKHCGVSSSGFSIGIYEWMEKLCQK